MRLAFAPLALVALALAGCQLPAGEPELSARPHATIVGTHVDVDGDRVDTFRLLEIDGSLVLPRVDQPVKLVGKDASDLVASDRRVHVEIEGFAFYRSTSHRLFWDPMRAHGVVDFVPAPGATYTLHGAISSAVSSVWIENEATHEVVGHKISVPGRDAAAAAEAESASAPAQ